MDLKILYRSHMMKPTPELASPSPNFVTTLLEGRLDAMYDLTCNRSHSRWNFSGIGFRMEVWRGRCQLKCCPRNLTAVQNYEVGAKIALVCFKTRR
ncbi:hypothetical protein AVEN_244358-1 [Araneus ventricosus]|uniref:Uncharacterized protein n=1 Tax=Araneus ventricosus TaxID=182803 RepID=A0A4Y2IM29_ARAVE|nr:hypothetical protein AVEN_244358-1 [Araneus ventricosus]